MAYPTFSHSTPSHPQSTHPTSQAAPSSSARCGAGFPRVLISEADHQREKLEFALAVAVSRGDAERCASLRRQISALGAGGVEPGT
ncbi:hypothetical protein CyaNS01_00040 [Cyanobium sp. NS01]|nr:hypothetical protein [Cyanobium sp. NS01]QNI69203.1 hypothetical protein CyaNS01_00040 [Cyanobium sp. NS01]